MVQMRFFLSLGLPVVSLFSPPKALYPKCCVLGPQPLTLNLFGGLHHCKPTGAASGYVKVKLHSKVAGYGWGGGVVVCRDQGGFNAYLGSLLSTGLGVLSHI